MRPTIIVRRFKNHRAVDLEKRLPILVGFLHEPVFHPPDPLPSGDECCSEFRTEHQAGSASLAEAIRCSDPAGPFPSQHEGEGWLPVRPDGNGDHTARAVHLNARRGTRRNPAYLSVARRNVRVACRADDRAFGAIRAGNPV